MSIGRIAVVNRGEPARRLIRAVSELKLSGHPLTTIALCTEHERHARFVREADEHHVIASDTGIAYLDYDELERALVATEADSAWVGWGFVAEHPQFADLCDRLGVTFIGPSGDVMRLLGDKVEAKRLAESIGAPVAPWSGGPVTSAQEAIEAAERIGFPLLVKAAAGGGGRGIRFVDRAADVTEAFERASNEAEHSFGDASVFLEKRLTGARHIEVQVAADQAGTVWALGVRDCSVQRRNQKLLEESASPALTADQHHSIGEIARELAGSAGYRNVGTVEFLYQPDEERFAFLEVNTRLQVEHPVTEATTGVDLVKLQLHLAAGGLLEGECPAPYGHAIEARLNAEDAQRGFAPAPGLIDHLDFALGPGIRIDAGLGAGDLIPPDYDSMIAKVIAWGRTREEARVRLVRALGQTSVAIDGGTTNKAFLTNLLSDPTFVGGAADTAWVDAMTDAGGQPSAGRPDLALMVAAIDAWDEELALERASFYLWAARGRPQSLEDSERLVECRVEGQNYRVLVARTSPAHYRLELDGRTVDVTMERYGLLDARLQVGEVTHRVSSIVDDADHRIEIDGLAYQISRDAGGVVRAPAPALVVSIAVEPGDHVDQGETLVVLESMKMETKLTSPRAGTVREVLTTASTQVDAGTPLLHLDSEDDTASIASQADRIGFDAIDTARPSAPDPGGRCRSILDELRWLVLGFSARDQDRLIGHYRTARREVGPDEAVIEAELALLATFADLCALSRNRPDDEASPDELHSPELYFHRYLRSLDVEAEGLPERFRAKLAGALRHLGLHSFERSRDLEEAAHQLFLAQRHIADRRPIIMAVLSQLPATADHPGGASASDPVPPTLRDDIHATLDHLIDTTQVRHATIGDQARSVRFRLFDEPTIEHNRRQVMATMHEHLAAMASGGDDRDRRIGELARCPYPLVGLLADHETGTSFERFTPLLEVLTVRNYQVRTIEHIDHRGSAATPALVTRYRVAEGGDPIHAVATLADADGLDAGLAAIVEEASHVDGPGRVVADVYVALDAAIDGPGAMADRAAAALARQAIPAAIDRVAFSAAEQGGRSAAVTFRRAGEGAAWVEDEPIRGIHPMIAVRLGLGRLREHFELEPLPAPAGTHLFRAAATSNPGDERLIAAAEVRDLATVLDDDGHLIALPGLDKAYTACIDGLRRAQIDRADNRRLLWNRILIYVWQPVDIDLAEAAPIVTELEPLGRGLGIEEVDIQARFIQPDGSHHEAMVRIAPQPGRGAVLDVTAVPTTALRPVNDYERKVVSCRQRGTVYPYELTAAIAGAAGRFDEFDLDDKGVLGPVERPAGTNEASIVVGMATTPTKRYPEGMRRMVLLGDPTKSLGSLAETECRIIMGALDRAEAEGLPVEWFALSSGARISMDSGTENMDWIAAALRRIVTFTQAGGEINIIVTGINVGAQPYWNAEATMLQHTKGILVMTPESAMVLTGKQALDISGGVSAEDNFGIGGYDRIMGPNGQAQYWAPDLAGAREVLFAHYDHAYRAPGERFPRPAATDDPAERDVRDHPHPPGAGEFATVGEVFSESANPGRKKPFDIRAVMRAVIDQDSPPLERWAAMHGAESAVVFDARLGGRAVSVIGIESRPLPRHGALPADGPDQWTAGTLFPRSSKKVARAINAASGNRPIVFLANLSGFDGSPESLRELQLEHGAEIGRAIVNFDGPIVFCVVSRYHGGAFVVFSSALNDNMEVLAVEGTYASVLGGAPAAAVVFAGVVAKRVAADPRLTELEDAIRTSTPEARPGLRAELATLTETVRSERLGEVAAEFDAVHSIERAREVGSVDRIISARSLRPELIDAIKRGMERCS